MKRGLLPMILCLALATTPALAGDECGVPVQHWQSRDAALRHATSLGWQVRSLKIDDGCYEIRGTDRNGLAFKAKVDPETLEIVKFRHRDRDDDRHGSRRQRPPASQNDTVGGTSSNTLLGTTVRPKTTIK